MTRKNQREGAIEITEDMTEDEYRLEEYKVLIKNSGNDVEDFHSINYPIENYNPVIRKYFKSISLVPKLKEHVRLLVFPDWMRLTGEYLKVRKNCDLVMRNGFLRLKFTGKVSFLNLTKRN